MVTKLVMQYADEGTSSVLAKIHMVTKHMCLNHCFFFSSVLAKILMVTKHKYLSMAVK